MLADNLSICFTFSQDFPGLRSVAGHLARWAEARVSPEDDITNDGHTRPDQDSKTTNNNPARESQSGAIQEQSQSECFNIYFSEADCEIVFILLFYISSI